MGQVRETASGPKAVRAKDALGRDGEELAARHLVSDGFVILERNWRCDFGEVDILARDADVLVVCEVKTRRSASHGSPFEAVTQRKLHRLERLGLRWMRDRGVRPASMRVDVVSVLRPTTGPHRHRARARPAVSGVARTRGVVLLGVDGHVIGVEAHVSIGVSGFSVVGMADKLVNEARDRCRSAVINTGLEWPGPKITVGLLPGGAAQARPDARPGDRPRAARGQRPGAPAAWCRTWSSSASWGSTAGSGRCAARSSRPSRRVPRARAGSWCRRPTSTRPRSSPASRCWASARSPGSSRWCAATTSPTSSSTRTPTWRRGRATRRRCPTSPTSAVSTPRGLRSSSPPPAVTTSP